ncbi:MAG: GbsR/MarR family transcriptional regulator [Thermomicrobiales bacterium]
MSTTPDLSPAEREIIERVGLFFEQYHLSRIGGRLLGLLLLVEGPLGLEEMATALGVSRASVSTNIRQLASFGMTEHISLPGDRRDYYRLGDNAWQRTMEVNIEGTRILRRIAEQGVATCASDHTTRDRLEELLAFCDFAIDDQYAMIARWQELRQRLPQRT